MSDSHATLIDEIQRLKEQLAAANTERSAVIAENHSLHEINTKIQVERKAAEARLPEGMKDCTIIFRQCEKGHGWLTAKNWIDHGCPTCRQQAVESTLKLALEELEWGDREMRGCPPEHWKETLKLVRAAALSAPAAEQAKCCWQCGGPLTAKGNCERTVQRLKDCGKPAQRKEG